MLALLPAADSVELKATVPDTDHRSAVEALDMDPLEAEIRQVFFFDTPNLRLFRNGLVVRARRVQRKGSDSIVKLRPIDPVDLPARFRDDAVVEVDAMPGGFVCSATLKRSLEGDDVREVARGKSALRKLFSKRQREFFAARAATGRSERPRAAPARRRGRFRGPRGTLGCARLSRKALEFFTSRLALGEAAP
jgi:hypothetical protein